MQPRPEPGHHGLRVRRHLGRLGLAAGAAWLILTVAGPSAPPTDAADPSPSPSPSGPSASPAAAGDPTAPVYVVEATGIVDNVMAGYIEEAVKRAAADASPAVVVMLNTPGGSLDSTQRIVTALLDAPLPAIVWVAPSGGHAASAGTFITLAANLAYMAPGTNIGAASPVGAGGAELEGTIGEKVRNDAMKNIRAIAEARGRNVDWAVSTVETAASASASEAVALGAVDGIATSLEDLRRQADGQVVEVKSQQVTVDIADAPFVDLPMNPFQSLIHLLSDPNVAFILLTLGFYALLFELMSPNFVTGILGAIALILAFIGFGSLPLNLGGCAAHRVGGGAVHPGDHGHESRPARDRCAGLLRPGCGRAVHDAGHPDSSRRDGRPATHRHHGARDRRVHDARAGDRRAGPPPYTRLRWRVRGGWRPAGPGRQRRARPDDRWRRWAWSTRPARSGPRRSGSGTEIASGERVRVLGQEGLTLIVEPWPAGFAGSGG